MIKSNFVHSFEGFLSKSAGQLLSGSHSRFLGCLLAFILFTAIPPIVHGNERQLPEERTAKHFESIKTEPFEYQAFLRQMPKGGDLHTHLSGAVYAETYIQWAAQKDLCVDQRTFLLSETPCDESSGRPKASKALTDTVLYRQIVDAWSMRNWQYSRQSGHNQFFDTFGKFGMATDDKLGDMIAEVTSRAAANRVNYLELMLTPDKGKSMDIGKQLKWSDDFGKMREELLRLGISQSVEEGRRSLNSAEDRKRQLLKCNTGQADPGCSIPIRYIFQILRATPPEQVFAQLIAAMELASIDPRIVALNLVQPEDSLLAMNNFSLQIRMLDYLHAIYPKVHITLHAGELTHGLVPPEGLRFHIRDSIRKGHAERIGHGVDVMYEDYPFALLQEMAEKNIMVEICLSSNDLILGVRGKKHPLATYLKYGVPVALATDDEGVSRSDMTQEYVKAVEEHALTYLQLKTMARTSLEHAFIAGASIWKDAKRFIFVQPCATEKPDKGNLSDDCRQFLESNEKAKLQWELERAFVDFEKNY